MTDAFANLVSPVMRHVIDLQQRVEEGDHPPLDLERNQILALLGEAEQKAGAASQTAHDFELAKHAVVYWIDEVLVNSRWRHAADWRQRILEWDIYQERLRAERFFEKAQEAEALAGTDPLETFYLCVALGFRGQYADSPKDLQRWADRVYNRVLAGSSQPDKFLPDDATDRDVLRPLPGKSILLAVSLLVALSVLFTVACFVVAVPPW